MLNSGKFLLDISDLLTFSYNNGLVPLQIYKPINVRMNDCATVHGKVNDK